MSRGAAMTGALRAAKPLMAAIDVATVLFVLAREAVAGAARAGVVAALAAAMFAWHRLENTTWRRRLGVARVAVYPAGRVWPHAAYSTVLCLAALERLLPRDAGVGLGWGALGLVSFAGGVVLRLRSFSALGAAFVDPLAGDRPTAGVSWRRLADLGFFAVAAGSALCLASRWALAGAAVLVIPALFYAAWRDDRERRSRPIPTRLSEDHP